MKRQSRDTQTEWRRGDLNQRRVAKVCADRGLELQKRSFNKPVTDLYHRALDLHPQCYDALNNISVILRAAGRLDMAIGLFRRALAANDRMPVAYGNLANVLMDTEHMEAAIEQFHGALELGGDKVEAQEALGNAFKSQSRLDKARHHFRKALDINTNNGLAIKLSLSFPVIANSKSQLESERRRLEREVEALLNRETTVPEPFTSPGVTNFHAAYMGLDDRALQEKVARLFRKSTRSLSFVADHCRTPKPAANFKIRIGFISNLFFDHTIGKLTAGIMANLSRDRFEVWMISAGRALDKWRQRLIESVDQTLATPKQIDLANETIAARKPDVLFYTDIGMDPFTYLLGFSRLAPVQCVTWGYPS